ncbi:MAG: LysR family transcriptional regulator [Clostridiales Family XIII bacterium]|nr:LysR family transcriptional regulator [Clostridiales Family XIII bacterium]
MNVNHLRYFMEVCRHQSFTKASESLNISQPAITAAIKELENELNYRLFDRFNNRIALTENGERFSKLTRGMLDRFDNYYNEALDMGNRSKTLIRLGLPAILSTFFYKRIVPAFNESHPNTHLVIFEVPTLTGLRMLDEVSLDFLIGILDDEPAHNHERRLIFDTTLDLFVHKDNPLAKEKSISSEMLIGRPFVFVPKGSRHYELLMDAFKDVSLDITLYSTQISTIRYMLENNMAATILYKQVFDTYGVIRRIPLAKPIRAQIGLNWKKNTYLNAAMKSFISFATKLQE